jgi:FkbM family methyltransferase
MSEFLEKNLKRVMGRLKRTSVSIRAAWHQRVVRKPFMFKDQLDVRMMVSPTENLQDLFTQRRFFDDEGTVELCRRILRPDMTVLDVGANRGQFSLFAARLVGEKGRVHSFEPGREAWKMFLENIKLNNEIGQRIIPNHCAVKDSSGSVEFYEYAPEHSIFNSMHSHEMEGYVANGSLQTVKPLRVDQVPAVSIDDYCEKNDVSFINLLKVDVEGWEVSVLRGAQRLFDERRCKQVIFEISLAPLQGTPYSPTDVFHLMFDNGFRISQITCHGKLQEIDIATFVPPGFANYLATIE